MRLYAIPIVNYNNINSFSYGNQWTIRAGDVNTTLYFQIVDLDKGPQASINGPIAFGPTNVLQLSNGWLRYLVGIGSTNQPAGITVTFPSNAAALNTFITATGGFVPYLTSTNFPVIDPSQVFNLTAVQADPNDPSIWKVTLPTNVVPNSGNVQFAIQEGNNIRRFSVTNMISVEQINEGSC